MPHDIVLSSTLTSVLMQPPGPSPGAQLLSLPNRDLCAVQPWFSGPGLGPNNMWPLSRLGNSQRACL